MTSDAAYQVSVRSLCAFTAKAGDLDLRFTPSPTAQEGIAGHSLVTSRRGEGYEREITLKGSYKSLIVKGRADGYDPSLNRLEEIKTFRGNLDLMPGNHRALHWAQVKIYGHLLCQERELPSVDLALVYLNITDQKETILSVKSSRAELQAFFEEHCAAFLEWARQETDHRQFRNEAMDRLEFPFTHFRKGQRQLAEAVYKSAYAGRYLLAEAPTGIGKTLGTLFPLLKALPRKDLDKIFFLCAKTPGRQLALEATARLRSEGLRTIELVARDKSCEHPDKACHGESCPLAQGFYDRLPAARRAAAEEALLTQAQLREIALSHQICPYYLAQEMVRWSDVVIGDYNYYFDLSAMLFALTVDSHWQVAVLVDEAHNLVDRGRHMYSAELDQLALRRIKKLAPEPLKRRLERLNREWNALNRTTGGAHAQNESLCLLDAPPAKLIFALQNTSVAFMDFLAEQPSGLDSEVTQFYFDTLHFLRVAELFDEQSFLADLSWRVPRKGRPGSVVSLRNLVPAALLEKRFAAAHTATLFSATLQPHQYYSDVLGLPETTWQIRVESPFAPEQLEVQQRHISTRYQDREASIAPIADLIADQYTRRPGNYLAFFSSYDYLNRVAEHLKSAYPNLPVWTQNRYMDESARKAFLDRYQDDGQGIGFAVLGGAFAEGIDLPGKRLVGAFIATLGLPQSNPINEQIKRRMQQLFGDGYNYTYLYPGLRKVVQAAGRVIRTEGDEGVVFLIDDRFGEYRVRSLLPHWWQTR